MSRRFDSRWIAAKQFMAAEQQKLVLGRIDRLSRDFLDWILVRSQLDKPLHIQEIVMESDIASPATVHKSIDVLVRVKLIDVIIDQTDHRRRLVRPTALALEELKTLDKSFQAWIRKSIS